METPQPAQRSNRNLVIGIVAAILIFCFCLAAWWEKSIIVERESPHFFETAESSYKATQHAGEESPHFWETVESSYKATQDATEQTKNVEIPTDIPSEVTSTPGPGDGGLPQGGRSDDVSRAAAWRTILLTGSIFDCASPTVAGTTIEVVQEPDSSGVWVENWSVACGEGVTKAFTITFAPAGGATNVNVRPAK